MTNTELELLELSDIEPIPKDYGKEIEEIKRVLQGLPVSKNYDQKIEELGHKIESLGQPKNYDAQIEELSRLIGGQPIVSGLLARIIELENQIAHIPVREPFKFFLPQNVWIDLFFPTSVGRIGGANQPSFDPFQGNTEEYTFGVNDFIHLPSQEISHGYKHGSDLEFHVHAVTNGSDVGDTEVNYEVEYTIGNIDGVMSAAAIITSGDFTIPGGTADRTHLRVEVDTVVFADLKSMASIKMRFRRIARVGIGADPGSNPFVKTIGVHLEQDTIGSKTEDEK